MDRKVVRGQARRQAADFLPRRQVEDTDRVVRSSDDEGAAIGREIAKALGPGKMKPQDRAFRFCPSSDLAP